MGAGADQGHSWPSRTPGGIYTDAQGVDFGSVGKGQGPHRVACPGESPQPSGVPEPRDSQALPPLCLAQSGALRDTAGLCPPCACLEGAGCPLQAPLALCCRHSCRGPGAPMGMVAPMGYVARKGPGCTHECPQQNAIAPWGSRGWGEWLQGSHQKGESFQFGAPQAGSRSLGWGAPLPLTLQTPSARCWESGR